MLFCVLNVLMEPLTFTLAVLYSSTKLTTVEEKLLK